MADNNSKAPQSPVALQRCADYRPEAVDEALDRLLGDLGGLEQWVAGRDVLLKPNFLLARAPDRAVNTHPQVVRAMARAALSAGARRVAVADSPAVGKGRRVAAKLGLPALLDPLGVEVVELNEKVEIERPGAWYGRLKLARRVLEADVVINLAKLKTHGLCGLTMAVKNCFGAVVGLGKARWHMRAGRDTAAFAQMLVDICRAVGPALSVVDAVEAMDGNGPSSGRARRLGFLAAGCDPFVLDRVLARICNVDPAWVATFGPDGNPDPDAVRILGTPATELVVSDWRMPRRFFSKRKAPAPHFSHRACTLCEQCLQVCQSGALSIRRGRVRLSRGVCIRCYCCQEICPEGAIALRRGWFRRYQLRA